MNIIKIKYKTWSIPYNNQLIYLPYRNMNFDIENHKNCELIGKVIKTDKNFAHIELFNTIHTEWLLQCNIEKEGLLHKLDSDHLILYDAWFLLNNDEYESNVSGRISYIKWN